MTYGTAKKSIGTVDAWRKGRWLGAFIVGATACATQAPAENPSEAPMVVAPPPADAGDDATSDADVVADAGVRPCADCEYFPDDCSVTSLCPNGPFGSDTNGGAIDPLLTINVIRGRSPNDVWAAGALGALAHFDGTSWTRSDLGSRTTLHGLWLRDSGEVAISSFFEVYTRGLENADAGANPSPGGWTSMVPTVPVMLDSIALTYRYVMLSSTWSAPGGNWLWYAAQSKNTSLAGGLWRMRRTPSNALEVGAAVPAAVCTREGCPVMNGIHGASANTLWAVGESGSSVLVGDADGPTPSVRSFNTQTRNALNAVWMESASSAWAVGAHGTIRRYTGDPSAWDIVSDVPTNENLLAVWGASSNDVWAVGDAGVVLHYDGTAWSRVKVAGLGIQRPSLTTVWVPEPGHVWIGGEGVTLSLGGKP